MALILGTAGACRRDELVKLTIDDIEDKDTILVVKIHDTKLHTIRTFIVSNTTLDLLLFYRKYVALRPPNAASRRFFMKYSGGKCCNQVVGLHTIGKVPFVIATYLQLSDPTSYTGHCFRRSSATLLGGIGADSNVKRRRVWKSTHVAESNLGDSVSKKVTIMQKHLSDDTKQLTDLVDDGDMSDDYVDPSTSGIHVEDWHTQLFFGQGTL